MKRLFLAVLLILLAFRSSTAHAQAGSPSVTQTVGMGSNISYFVINFNDGAGNSNDPSSDYVFAYHWDSADSPTSETMLADLSQMTSPQLQVNQTFYPDYNAYFVNGFTYLTHSQTGYYNSGTDQAAWAYWVMDSGTWTQPQAYGVSGRPLVNGSYDGWTFHVGPGSAPAPVIAAPEPSSLWSFFGGAGGLVILIWRRHSHKSRPA